MSVAIIRPGVTPMTESFARELVQLFVRNKFIPGEEHPKEPLSFDKDIKLDEWSVMWDEQLMRWAVVHRYYLLPPSEGLRYSTQIYSVSYNWKSVEYHGTMLPGSMDACKGIDLPEYITD